MPKGVKEIGLDQGDGTSNFNMGRVGPFTGCRDLTSVTFPPDSELTKIKYLAFARTGLTAFEVPMGVTEIQSLAFFLCDKLSTFTFASTTNLVVKAPGTWGIGGGPQGEMATAELGAFSLCAGKPLLGVYVFHETPLEQLMTLNDAEC